MIKLYGWWLYQKAQKLFLHCKKEITERILHCLVFFPGRTTKEGNKSVSHPFPKKLLPYVGSYSNFSLSLWPKNQQKPKRLFVLFLLSAHYNEGTGHLLVFLLIFLSALIKGCPNTKKADLYCWKCLHILICKMTQCNVKRSDLKRRGMYFLEILSKWINCWESKSSLSFYSITANFCPGGYRQFKIPG